MDEKTDEALYNIFAMSNLRPKDSGVDGVVIWVSTGDFEGKRSKHGPRIKVILGTKTSVDLLNSAPSVTLTSSPAILNGTLPPDIKKHVFVFIKLNLDVLLRYWNGDIGTKEMVDQIKAIK